MLDGNGDGKLNKSDIRVMMSKMGYEANEENIDFLISTVGKSGN